MTRRRNLAVAAALFVGIAAGLGLFTFGYARGYSYLTNDPQACANCHVMSEHFSAWNKGSHHAVATCNDCHTPHTPVAKYIVKAKNGFWHSFYFTVGGYPDPLRITEGNRKVTENACRYCHAEITETIDHVATRDAPPARLAAHGGLAPPTARLASQPTSQPALQLAPTTPPHARRADDPISCIRCHQYVGHWVR